MMNHDTSKMVSSIHEALVKCGAHDGMTLGFHHHFRDGDLVVNMVMQEVHNMGIKDVTICASSLGKAHDALVPMIEDGTITNIQSSGVRGKIGEAISAGKLKGLAIMRSHGGRIRAIQTGETVIDISFIGAPTCDDYGNCKGVGGKSDCGVLSYSFVDGNHANKVVAVTDCLVPFPNYPADINMTKVDYVCVVDQIGIPEKDRFRCSETNHRCEKADDGGLLYTGCCKYSVFQRWFRISDRCWRCIYRICGISRKDHERARDQDGIRSGRYVQRHV